MAGKLRCGFDTNAPSKLEKAGKNNNGYRFSIPTNDPIILNDLNVHLEPFHSFGFAFHWQDVLPIEADSARMGMHPLQGVPRFMATNRLGR
ncbi:hypothetical protein LB553_18950 [Mesorhizobium sp. CA8]|uniref:hypothetical protein n=1 Tax=Mesorhizobium sp. CA8 TaxID=2876637 RepID=UPI001CC9EB1B|nr:hypothetical protein [Mesorhizobium sp. CA8]MBZ9762940.1 hypothetical protein [Mesorhizobium sp. CA8]